jgi:conjugative transfer signal peptidase TraF
VKRVLLQKALGLYTLATVAVACAATMGAAIPLSGHELVFNDSPSVPRGFYWIALGARPTRRGEYVVFAPPADAAVLIYSRGWLPKSMPLLKSIGAIEGDTYCIEDGRFRVNGVDAGPVFATDAGGLPMPRIVGCRRVGDDEFLPVSTYSERSFDGRYMGAVPTASIIGTGHPLLTF